ncbi:MAG: TIGR00303 family protein [Cyanobacteriota bacterium]|nr:TIGR00303 family protein [Cyanobacteriota bacterium]
MTFPDTDGESIRVYTQPEAGVAWLERYRGCPPVFACVLGFTQTGLIPGISAAGRTPADRRYTAIADAEFLIDGPQPRPQYPLPPLDAGASPVLISRAAIEDGVIPVRLFDAGLPQSPAVEAIDLGGTPARCLSTGKAMDLATVEGLLDRGLLWGAQLAREEGYLILGECVVGGTTTALAVLTGLGFAAAGKVNSSHPTCNHAQKWDVVRQGLQRAGWDPNNPSSAIELAAAVGDPMQVAVAGMAIAASRTGGVLLAGGTQMLAVYALARAIAREASLPWQPSQIAVGTTRWVAEDPTGDTGGLALEIGEVPLLATQLDFSASNYAQLRAYERGYVKEGVGAGGCSIAAHLYRGWSPMQLQQAIDGLALRQARLERHRHP